MSYPTIKIDQESTKTAIKEAIRTDSEGGYGRTRSKFTKPRYQFDLVYKAIDESSYTTLENFFVENQGSTFSYLYPRDNETYTVMFAMDKITPKYVSFDKISTEISLISI